MRIRVDHLVAVPAKPDGISDISATGIRHRRVEPRRAGPRSEDVGGLADILVKRRGVVELIIDTKWKRVARQMDDPKRGVSQSDIYQMIAYGQLYDCTDLLLLYPHHAELGSTVGVFGTHRIKGTARLLRGATLGLHGDSKAELGALATIRPLSGPPSHQRPTSSDPQQNAD
ncbi:hypothetical protein V8F63_07915 [Brevundimonas sp. LF-1]|uniref:5-methylcytosine restriction system specificity protein McrC n=1 Tax=Brevundimonas sp. LF-1 TaxID=3126100 RepID=UPI0030E1AB04